MATVGDAVINLAIAAILYGNSGPIGPFLTSARGDLTIERSKFVNDRKLAQFFEKTGLRQYLRVASEAKEGKISISILAQSYEAIVGAIFLDSDYDSASGFVRRSMMEK